MPLDLLELEIPIAVRPAGPVSDAELMRLSQANPAYRLERNKEGEITMMTPVTGNGGYNEALVLAELFVWARADGRGKSFSPNTGFVLPDGSCLMPDACWVALDRWNRLTPEQHDEYVPLCPDFVIEVRSKTDRRRPLVKKMRLWVKNGARLAWLIDPIDGTVTIYRPDRPEETLHKPPLVAGIDPIAGFVLNAAELWTIR